jgi:hypothetical protein
MAKLIPTIATVRRDDWNSVIAANRDTQLALDTLSGVKLGSSATPIFGGITLTNLTANRLVASDATKSLVSSDLINWVTGTANRVTVADDSDGTITLSGPQDIHTGASPTFTGLTLSGLTQGSVLFAGSGGLVSEDNTRLYWDDSNNRLGVGTQPSDTFHVLGNSILSGEVWIRRNESQDTLIIQVGSDTDYIDPFIKFRRSRGTYSAPTAVQDGDELGTFVFRGYDGTDWETAAMITCKVDGTPGDDTTDMPGELGFYTTPDGTIRQDGKVGINDTTPSTTLAVDGTVGITGATSITGRVDIDVTTTTSNQKALDSALILDTSGGDIAVGVAARSIAYISGGNGITNNVLAHQATAQHAGSGTVVLARALQGQVQATGTGTVTDSVAIYGNSPYITTGAVTNSYGLYLEDMAPSGVTNSWGIYQVGASDLNYFAGHMKFGGGVINNTTRITSGPYNVLATDHVILVDTDGGAITVNLPAGVEGTNYKIINVGSSGNDVTVDPNGTEQLYAGGAGVSFALIDGEVINIHYNATEGWW